MIGALYFASAITAGAPLIYVPSKLMVAGDSAATSARILAHERLFRASMVSELLGALLLFWVVSAIYGLLCNVNIKQAILMLILAVLSIPITFLSVTSEAASLVVLHSASLSASFTDAQRSELALLFLQLHGAGISMANVFWGLWLVPFGLLVLRSEVIPRLLGIWLLADGMALVAVSVMSILSPTSLVLVNRVAILPELGELAVMVWFLVKGVRPPPPESKFRSRGRH